MEYSPMMVVMLWALTPSDCSPTGGGLGEPARVVEIPQPIMSVHPEGYFTFNHGRPFVAERNPVTGDIDSNIKTTPVTNDDYLYDEYEESGESIDRKDSTKIYTRNDISTPSKDSDLHKFLNLPVHYSSSGKFPLISSSYANTKVQGHGPLSNHKLYSSSTSTTSTVSPSYYPLKTTAVTTTAKFTTPTPTTVTTSTTAIPSQRTTTITTTTTTMAPSTTKTTSTLKPLLPNYEYEYDYDYEKNDGEGTEKTSHDYEFLGASSEVTTSYGKPAITTNAVKPSSAKHDSFNDTQEQTTAASSAITFNDPTNKSVPTVLTTEKIAIPIAPFKNEKGQQNLLKIPNIIESTTANHDETLDLKPPKPDLSIELRPPQAYPTRPYSSVVPTKPLNLGHPGGFVRYPDSPLVVEAKKPFSVYSPQNSSKPKPDFAFKISEQSKLSSYPHEEKQSSTTTTKYTTEITQKNPSKKDTNETQIKPMVTQNNSRPDTTSFSESNIKKPFDHNKNNVTNHSNNPQEILIIDKHPYVTIPPDYNLHLKNPVEKYKDKVQLDVKKSNLSSETGHKKPQGTSVPEHNYEGLLTEHYKQQGILLKPEYRPQTVPFAEHSQLQGMIPANINRPQHTLHMPVQVHTKPTNPSQESNNNQGASNMDTKRIPRPPISLPENTRLQIKVKPENIRPQSTPLVYNNKPLLHYSPEYNRPPNYQVSDSSRPQNQFGLRIPERQHGPDRTSGMELRPHSVAKPQIVQHESKVPTGDLDGRPHQGMVGSEIRPGEGNQRPEGGTKPIIFSKPQSGKRPDHNTVQFGQTSKVENHFISVSPGHENPSYSLQTSFSIGVPPPEQKQTPSGSHGVGQVLFPDEEAEKRQPIWPHHRPPQISQPESHPNIQIEKYPRPPWESHLKPPHIYHKKEPYPPNKRKPLPNILPQFRPNAKIGHAEPHIYLKPREPFDTLQPPPLPRPQFLRLEQDLEDTKPLVHRRNGQSNSRVTTLQMMQGLPASKRAALRIDDSNEKNEPVFVVYPSNGNSGSSPPSDGVVVGTRGSQRPLPPDNLDIGDDLDSFPLDSNKNFQTRVDTPILKSKPTSSKPIIKNDFPYTLIKPNTEERITAGGVVTKEYTAFSPTVPSLEKDHDTEINIIPYLQDYMPFATKKPSHKDAWLLGSDVKHLSATIGSKLGSSEMTPSPHKNDNHRVVSEGPQPQDFQAPFHASLTAPSQGWSVVQKKPNKEKSNDEITTTKELGEVQTTEKSKFDIQNFKPQLFGGFKPIVPPIDNKNKESANH